MTVLTPELANKLQRFFLFVRLFWGFFLYLWDIRIKIFKHVSPVLTEQPAILKD